MVDQRALQDINEQHAYFIGILEEVLKILAPHVASSVRGHAVPVRHVSSKIGEAQGKILINPFENVEMEEPQDQEFLEAPVIDVPDVLTAVNTSHI